MHCEDFIGAGGLVPNHSFEETICCEEFDCYEEWENGFGIGAGHLHINACGATEAWGVDFDLLVPIPDGVDIYDFHLIMFNRWGVIVWESYNTVGRWDGTYGGDSVQDGVYVWVIHAKDRENDKVYEFKEL